MRTNITWSVILLMALSVGSVAHAEICKQEMFNDPGPGMLYTLDTLRGDRSSGACSYPVSWQSGGQWCVAHDAAGGDAGDGDGAAHLIFRAGQNQFNSGWFWGHACDSWSNGDTLRLRLKIKFDSNYIWSESHNNKFMIWGAGGYRMIVFIRGEYWTASDCRPYGVGSYSRCSSDGSSCNTDADCVDPNGVQYMCVETGSYVNRGAISVGHDIDRPCAGPAERDVGGLGIDEWNYLQIEVKSGPEGYEKIWINNNSEAEPNACTGSAAQCGGSTMFQYSAGRNAVQDITVAGWDTEQTLGDFWTDAVSRDMGYYVDDMIWERNGTFDNSWYPGGNSTCGNGTINAGEVCDGNALAGQSCTSQGFLGGSLACAGSCTSFDTSGCTNSTTVFASDFEHGDFSEWSRTTEQSPGNLQVVADEDCPGGRYCARAQLTAETNNDNSAHHYFGDHPDAGGSKVEELWLALRTKFDPGYVWPSSGQEVAVLSATNGASAVGRYLVTLKVGADGVWSLQHSYIDRGNYFENPQNVGAPQPVPRGGWVRLKLYTRMNTPGQSDGILRLWVDGLLKLEYTDVNLRENAAYGFGELILSSRADDAGVTGGAEWYDEWRMSLVDPDGGVGEPPVAAPPAPIAVRRTDTVPTAN